MASQVALCAKAIKTEIKTLFPNAIVRASSRSFSMGCSVDVSVAGIEDEEARNTIKALAGKYKYGHFNGMEDIYECSNSRADIPQAKYVFVDFRAN